jgi:hypothetical protein
VAEERARLSNRNFHYPIRESRTSFAWQARRRTSHEITAFRLLLDWRLEAEGWHRDCPAYRVRSTNDKADCGGGRGSIVRIAIPGR